MTRRAVWGRLTMDRPVPVAGDRSTTSSTIFSFENTFAGALRSSSNLRSSTKESSCSVARLLSAGITHITHANRGALHSVGEGRVSALLGLPCAALGSSRRRCLFRCHASEETRCCASIATTHCGELMEAGDWL